LGVMEKMSMSNIDVEMIVPQDVENEYLDDLNDSYETVSEMTEEERQFLNSLLRRNKPKKLLEIGIASGSSSVIMLNAIKDIEGAMLYSIDRSVELYHDKQKATGYIVDNYPELKTKWKLYVGGLSFEFIEDIGGEIDFALIDTVHFNPGEILDFLMILPFLSEAALVVFHDTNLHTIRYPYFPQENPLSGRSIDLSSYCITNNLLISSIHGEKIIVNDFIKNDNGKIFFGNIAGIRTSNETKNHVFEIMNLLTLKWKSNIPLEKRKSLMAFLKKYYNNFYIEYLDKVFNYQDKCFAFEKSQKEKEKNNLLECKNSVELLSAEIKSLKESKSWKITAPLRLVKKLWKR